MKLYWMGDMEICVGEFTEDAEGFLNEVGTNNYEQGLRPLRKNRVDDGYGVYSSPEKLIEHEANEAKAAILHCEAKLKEAQDYLADLKKIKPPAD